MKTKQISLLISVALLLAGTAFSAEPDNSHPYLGVLLDMSPLPELLTKHLGLSPGQGVRIRNIQINSPAEEAGLERDDIIIRIQDQDIYKYESVVFAVLEASVGEEMSIEIIHLGQRKTMKIKLDESKGEPEWKFPPEPELEQSWRPGRIFQFKPGENDWTEILSGDIPAELQQNIHKMFQYNEYRYYTDDQGYKVNIEGDPKDGASTITVSKGDTKHQATIKEIDKLPEGYRHAAERALKNALEDKDGDVIGDSQPSTDTRNFFRKFYPDNYEKFFQQPSSQQQLFNRMFQPNNQTLDRMTEQMNQLMERMKELEKSQSELLDRLTEKQQLQKTHEQQESIL